MSVFSLFATIGYGLSGLIVFVAATVAMTLLVGILFSMAQAATKIGNFDSAAGMGSWCGFLLGLIWTITGFYTSGVFQTLVSSIGLGVVIAVLAWVCWFISEHNRPVPADYGNWA